MYITEKTHVLDELCSDTGYSAAGCGLHVNKSPLVYIQKKEEEIRQSVWEINLESARVASVLSDGAMGKKQKSS